MKKLFFLLTLCSLCACSSGDEQVEPPVVAKKLSTPVPTATISEGEAVISWAKVDNANEYNYELSEDGGAAQEGKCYSPGYRFKTKDGVEYSFRVKATPKKGSQFEESDWSEYLKLTNTMLKSPTLTLIEEALTDNSVAIAWSAVDGAKEYGWELRKGDEELKSGKTSETEIQINELEAGVAYSFRVMAYAKDANKQNSAWSSYLSFTTRKIEQLESPVATLARVNSTSAKFVWEAVEGAVKYECNLWLGDTITAEVEVVECESCEVEFSNLQEKTKYGFRVCAISDPDDRYSADSEFSESIIFTTPGEASVELGLPLANENDGILRAFPGAEGGGMYTTGGRGGVVYHVTNLDDSGEGSLRWAVEKSGPRIIVFDVAGTIKLKKTLNIKYGDLTIAGQTAPGDGICLRDYSVQISASNVIIRYLRFRMGDETNQENDAIWGRYNENIIIDHCSMSWSTDECGSFYANKNFTLQWCLLGESLRVSVHGKGNHGYGGIWGGKNASFHHNMLSCHDSRNPRIDHPVVYDNKLSTHRGNVDMRNNLIYNWGGNSTYGGEGGWFNIVGNYYKPGPASKERKYFVDAYALYDNVDRNYARMYLEDNYHAGSYASSINSNQWSGIYWHDGTNVGDVAGAKRSSLLPIKRDDSQSCYTSTHTPAELFNQIVEYVGASLKRDAVDTRLVNDAKSGKATYTSGGNGSKNGLIDTQSAVGGWPVLSATQEEIERAATDTDKDGIPDYYEKLFGLDSTDASDAELKTLDPQGIYSNLEVYLHYLVKDITAAQVLNSRYLILE